MANLSLQTLPPPASETRAGVVEFATQAEVNAGTVTDKVVTPATLAGWTGGGGGGAQPDASETVKGILKLATVAEVDAGADDTKAVTPLKLKHATDTTYEAAQTYADAAANDAASAAVAAIPDASTGARGLVELATTAETQAGSDTTRAVTSAGLAGAHSLAHSGTSTIDFGATLNAIATLDITGQTGIQTTSDIQCWIQGTDSTADHNTYEHAIAAIRVTAMSIIAGTGFTLVAVGINTTFKGQWKVRWRWYD